LTVTYDYRGTVAIVTGAARGIGRAVTYALVLAGARVVATDRDGDGLAESCRNLGDAVVPVTADITDADDAGRIVAAAPEHFGRLDFCVNSAAVAQLMTQAAARVLVAQGQGGRIVNFSAGEAASESLTRVAAKELAEHGILVNCVRPEIGPLARTGGPDGVAQVVLWLCSSGATYVTGTTLTVDGGG